MKKAIAFLAFLCMLAIASGCGNSESQRSQTAAAVSTVNEDTSDVSSDPETNLNASEASYAETEETASAPQMQESKVLVAYFSATNTTEGIAEHIAKGLNADIYEIIPETPYTDDDLNYNDSSSRTTIEMNDPGCRPAISGSVEDMEQYDVVFIGYPIWWGEAPRIVSTFMESYDFSGKTIVPFCTSSSSGIGSSADELEQLTGSAEWLTGKRFGGDDPQDTVMKWVNGLDLE